MMAESSSPSFGEVVRASGVGAAFGVPDSLMKQALFALEMEFGDREFTIAANEGAAVGLAIGHHLATGQVPLVFMQNSGLGNALNPLISLADSLVYSIPMILLVGWRGELLGLGHQKADEPQHIKQGQITIGQLELLGVTSFVLASGSDLGQVFDQAMREARDASAPVAIIVRSGALLNSGGQRKFVDSRYTTREEIIGIVAEATGPRGALFRFPVIATTGMASRELYEHRRRGDGIGSEQDFLTVGGMGHAISIAAAVAKAISPSKVVCLDGDGSVLMHMGALLHSAQQANLIHVVLDNGVHDSVGGQPTGFRDIDVQGLSRSLGYHRYIRVENPDEMAAALMKIRALSGSVLIHAMCEPGHRSDLGRPELTPLESKKRFMEFLTKFRNIPRA